MRKKKTTTTVKKTATAKEFVFHTVTDDELLPDGMPLLSFTIPGRPATKKTHQQIVYIAGKPRVLPSPQYGKYERLCKKFCEAAWSDTGKPPMDFGISIHVRIYLDTWAIGDHVGYLQSIGDILEKHKVIANDKFIHWTDDGVHWFGGVDKENPRCEIEIRRFRHPYENYRQDKEEAENKKILRKSAVKSDEK